MTGPVELSIVIPVRDEVESIPGLAAELEQALTGVVSWECIWVDDFSQDGSRHLLQQMHDAAGPHRLLKLAAGSGQSAALLAGFSVAKGELFSMLDGDGQNDPSDLPRLLRTLRDTQVDAVNGYRRKRQDNWLRKLSSRIANGTRNAMVGYSVRDVGCSIRVFRRECAMHLPQFKGMHRFLPTLFLLNGYRLGEIDVNHRPRGAGRTKYGLHNRLWVGIYDLVGVRWLRARHAAYHIERDTSS